ncbi:unnamed protein product [Rotaria socialis]|uniref:Anion exchange protein n=1 Tax=Rotaria socialis TaxID=392032 RepID=A0A818ARD8_9BILA|nr:unnamed protein product [Rotaria socialis]CAF4412380.1 unnamed protein product [Rotaria socialis]
MSRLYAESVNDNSENYDEITRRHSDTDTMVQHHHHLEKTKTPGQSITFNVDVPQVFCQLDVLCRSDETDYAYWKEKARWIRFEEIAENALGRWSKPHVATLMQTALLNLKKLLQNGVILLNVPANDLLAVSQIISQSLLDSDYFDNIGAAERLLYILGLPHFHHYEKRSVTKNASTVSLSKQDDENDKSELGPIDRRITVAATLTATPPDQEAIATDTTGQQASKEYNVKLQRKIGSNSEGASILICPVDFIEKETVVFVRLQKSIELPGMLEVKISSRFIVLLIGPEENEKPLLQMGRTMATILTDDICREFAYISKDSDEIMKMMDRFMQDTYVIPPSEWDPSIRIEPPHKYTSKEERQAKERQARAPQEAGEKIEEIELTYHADPTLVPSKRPFYGLITDIRNKLPYYISDFTDCASLQCLAATLYLFIVCLCSVVAFGGILGTATENYMATMECILAAAISGIIFALFGGQPLNIISATGPMLILEHIIEHSCRDYRINYLEFRLWIGVWIFILLLIFVIFNLSFLVRYITRFTEDCFASLVALIFIVDAIRAILNIRKQYPVNYRPSILLDYSCSCIFTDIGENETTINDASVVDYLFHGTNLNKTSQIACTTAGGFVIGSGCSTPVYHADIFFFSVLLFIFTFLICMVLKEFRNSSLLPANIRTILSDFAVLIAIVIMSVWDGYLLLNTPKLYVPTEFKPTRPHDRGWFIPFFGKNKLWTIPLAIIPALIATILIFMDQQITAVIINRKEFKLKKNPGYHLDLFVLSLTILIQSILGLPWFVAATVLALTHVNSLKLMSVNTAPGEKPKFEGIIEQRVSALLMSILTGLSVLFTQVLRHIPMPVLYGVFMFMGVSALRNMQIYDRALLFFMPQKYQPDYSYLRHVRISRVHLFTVVQIVSLVGLYVLKNIKSIAITFPLLILGTCFVRKLMDKVFTQEELYWLDDILPGSKIGRIRGTSMTRNFQISKVVSGDSNEESTETPSNILLASSETEPNDCNRDTLGYSLPNIVEVSKKPNVGSLPIDNTNESSVPLIVVNEIISSEETSANASEEVEHFMHRESPFEKHHDGKIKAIQTPV